MGQGENLGRDRLLSRYLGHTVPNNHSALSVFPQNFIKPRPMDLRTVNSPAFLGKCLLSYLNKSE